MQAMHLVYQCRESKPLPSALPADLVPPSHRSKAPAVVGGVLVMPQMPALNTGSSMASEAASMSNVGWSGARDGQQVHLFFSL